MAELLRIQRHARYGDWSTRHRHHEIIRTGLNVSLE